MATNKQAREISLQHAQRAYVAETDRANDLLDKLGDYLAGQGEFGNTRRDWGDVGDMKNIADQLAVICKSLNLK